MMQEDKLGRLITRGLLSLSKWSRMRAKASSRMSEGRRAQVILLDERKVELTIAPKLSGGDLLDLVVSYCNLKEKEYFGLAFMDETNHYNWLQPDKKVLDHELPRPPPGEALTLYFRVQYFSESIAKLRDSITIELFYLQAKESVYKGEIEVDSETAFELAAYVLQAVDGDYRSYQRAVDTLKKLPVLPQSTLKDHPSLLFCEERILFYYKQNIGFTTGQAIVCYMQVIESLPTYGVHYYEVKDKSGLPWWLGLSYKGIGQYDQGDRVTPRNVFHWKQLQNIYYQNRKFSIEVLDSKRVSHSLNSIELFQQQPQDQDSFDDLTDALTDPTTQVTVSRRTFGGGNATVHAWYGHPLMIRSMWTMAVSQHQFYLDRKHSKEMPANDKSLSQIANDLTVSTISLSSSQTSEHSSDDKLRGSTSSLKGSVSTLSKLKDKEKSSRELLAIEGEEARQQMVEALKERKAVLEERLREKIEALKKLCIKEAEITNKLPEEYPLTPGEPSPKFKRRMTTLYKLSDKHVNVEEFKNSEEQELNRLEKEFEIQSNITTAARKLANDPNISKKVRKTRRDSYKKSALKLDKIHKQLNTIRLQLGMSVIDSISMEVREDISNMESPGRKFSFTGTLPRKLGERGRSRTKESPDGKGRSKSVPRQLLDNFTRSPSLSRDEKEAPKRAPSPVILSTETIRKENFTNLATKPPPGRRVESNQYESIPRDLRRNNSDDGIAGDRHSYGTDTSSHSSASSRGLYNRTNSEYSVSVRKSTPPIYQSLQRLPRSGKGNNGSIEDFRIRLGSNNSLDSDLRAKRRGSTEAVPSHTRPTPPTALFMEGNPNSPPPVYGMVPRSYRQTGRYFESPELSSPIHEVQTSPKHAVSMHNLQHTAAPSQQYPSYTYDTDGYTHQAGRSVSQPPTPKKHASLGNLASQVNNSPTLEEEDTMTSNSMKGQLETGRGQGEHLSQGRYNVPRRHYDLDGDQYQYGYTQTDKGMHQSPRRGSHVPPQETVQSGRRRHNSFSSQHSTSSQSSINSHQSHSSQRSQTSLNQNGARNPGSHHSTPVKNKHVSVSYVTGSNGHQWSVNHGDHYPPPYQREDSFEQYQNYSQGNYPQGYDYHPRDSYDSYPQEENFGYQEDYNNYYSDQAYELPNFSTTYQEEPLQTSDNGDAYRSFTTQQSYSQSGLTIRAVSTPAIQSSQVPQPAPAYMTSAPAVSHSPHPPVYGTTIAVSKVHYQPATPMTCEPVTRKKKHHSHHLAGSPAFMRTLDYGYNYYCLPSLIALEDSDPVFLQRSEFSSPEGSEDSRENYSPYIEDAEYAADVDEYAEDDYDNEATQWNPEREPDRPPLQGKVRTGTLV